MEDFYQQSFYSYTLVPSLTLPTGIGFGPNFKHRAGTSIFNVFGPLWFQSFEDSDFIDMGFGHQDKLRELSTHEFGHSFVNPLLDEFPKELFDQTEKLFDPIKSQMMDQGYPDWGYCLDEHFVRAGEVIIARNMGGIGGTIELEKEYVEKRSFIYLSMIIDGLAYYNAKKQISYKEAVHRVMKKLGAIAHKK
ncbi:MAG: DUF4932 domain-containing protein [Saonia sp.]